LDGQDRQPDREVLDPRPVFQGWIGRIGRIGYLLTQTKQREKTKEGSQIIDHGALAGARGTRGHLILPVLPILLFIL